MWNNLPVEIQELIVDSHVYTGKIFSLINKLFYRKNKKINIQDGISVPLDRIGTLVYGYPLKVKVTDIDFCNINYLSKLPRCVETLDLSGNKLLPISVFYNLIQSKSCRYIKEINISNTCLISMDCSSSYTGIFAIVNLFDQITNKSNRSEIFQLINLKKIIFSLYYIHPFDNLLQKLKYGQIMPIAPNLESVIFKDHIWHP